MQDENPYRPAAADEAARRRGPEGRGGWLIAIAAILTLAALQAALGVGLALFRRWSLALPSDYRPGAQIVLAGDVAVLALSVSALILFARRSPWFPRLCVAAAAFDLALVAIKRMPLVLAGDLSVVHAPAIVSVCALFWHGPWIAYTLRSRRVRNTFRSARRAPRPPGIAP